MLLFYAAIAVVPVLSDREFGQGLAIFSAKIRGTCPRLRNEMRTLESGRLLPQNRSGFPETTPAPYFRC